MCIGFATKNWLKRGENKGENGSYNSRDNFQKKGEVGRLCFHDSGQIRHGKNPSQEYGPMVFYLFIYFKFLFFGGRGIEKQKKIGEIHSSTNFFKNTFSDLMKKETC